MNRLRAAREAKDLSLTAFADEVGVPAHDLEGYEEEKHLPPAAIRKRLADALQTTEAELFTLRRATRLHDDRLGLGRR